MPDTEQDEPAPEFRPAVHPWRELLQRWSDEWLDPVLHEQERSEPFPDAVRAARWLGSAGATPRSSRRSKHDWAPYSRPATGSSC